MTAPDPELTRLAVLIEVAAVAARDSGANDDDVMHLVMRMTFGPNPFVQHGTSEERMDRLCRRILRIQQSMHVLNLGVANVAFLNI